MNIEQINETNVGQEAIELLYGLKNCWCLYQPKIDHVVKLLLDNSEKYELLLQEFTRYMGKNYLLKMQLEKVDKTLAELREMKTA